MASTIHCDIVSAESEIYSGEASMVIVPGEQGDLGITPRHAPLLTRLRAGEVRVQTPDGGEEHFYVSGGLLEIQPHVITVLSDTGQRASDLDEAAALEAKAAAERALADKTAGMEVAQAQAQLAQAMAQLAALERFRKKMKH
jgi:F-type H+-transporting ATPase subunit epsilon